MKPSQAARVLLENYGLRAAGIEDFGPELPYWQSINRTDWQTLVDIAERYGRDICCMGVDVHIKRLMTMHKDWHAYEWGKSLISFEAVLSSEKQIQAHVTLGFDTVSGRGFRGSAQTASLPFRIGGKRTWSASPAWRDGLTHYEYDGGAVDAAHAAELSEAALLERNFKLFTGSAVVEGDPKLKPGATVEMKRVGEQFEGEYIVSHVIHTFSMEGGYITEFGIKRNTLNAGTGRGAALMQASIALAAPVVAVAGAAYGDDEDEGGSEVYSLMWRKEGARTEKVSGGEKVVLYFKVKDIADGEKAKFAVYKEGGDSEAVAELEGVVRNGVAEAEWETSAEAGEYRFEAECGGASSDECAVLEVDGIELCNLAWMKDESDIGDTFATVDDEVKLSCKANGIADGEKVHFRIYEVGGGDSGDDSLVAELDGEVEGGIAEAPWEVLCGSGSRIEREIEGQGWANLEYYFTAEYAGAESQRSKVMETRGAMRYELVNGETGEPVRSDYCVLLTCEGTFVAADADENGFIDIDGLKLGDYTAIG